jgi:hypothetical protein
MRDLIAGMSATAKTLTVGVFAAFAIGGAALAWNSYYGPRFADQQYQQFQHSQTHRGAVADDMAARCVELAQTSDPTTRKAIEGVIYTRTSGIDLNTLNLATDVRTCVDNAREDYLK